MSSTRFLKTQQYPVICLILTVTRMSVLSLIDAMLKISIRWIRWDLISGLQGAIDLYPSPARLPSRMATGRWGRRQLPSQKCKLMVVSIVYYHLSVGYPSDEIREQDLRLLPRFRWV